MFPPVELIQSHGLNRVHNLLHFLTIVRTHNETLFLPRNFSLDFAQVVDSVKRVRPIYCEGTAAAGACANPDPTPLFAGCVGAICVGSDAIRESLTVLDVERAATRAETAG